MPMVYVEGGTFRMGGTDAEVYEREKPVHTVTLSSFWIGKYEVTVVQYSAYCKETGIPMPEAPSWGWRDNNPVVNVNWKDANEFAVWLSKKNRKTL